MLKSETGGSLLKSWEVLSVAAAEPSGIVTAMPGRAMEPGSRPARPWRALGAGAGVLGGEGLAMALHPALGEAMAAADVIVPLAIVVVLIAAILAGSDRTCERVFRLLRWAANRPEPTAPTRPGGAVHGTGEVVIADRNTSAPENASAH